jgi:thymidine phosphorylase
VKTGSGAFISDPERSRELARTMVGLGNDAGVATVALVTDMSTPLGLAAGNAVEVAESIEVLAGGGPADVVELTLTLAIQMLALVGLDDVNPAEVLASGKAMDVWRAMISAQGGDPDAPLPQPRETEQIVADRSGCLARLDALPVGIAAWRLGAGRARKEDPVQAAAGILLHAKPGDRVTAGQPLITLQTDDPALIPRARAALRDAWTITDQPTERRPLIIDRIG